MHYLTWVILPNLENIEEKIEIALQGSRANPKKIYTTIQKRCFCIGGEAWSHSMQAFDKSELGQAIKKQIDDLRKQEDQQNQIEQLLVKRYAAVKQLEKQHPLYQQIDTDCDVCQGTGSWMSSRAPHFDWWVIGGQWNGLFEPYALPVPHSSPLKNNIAYIKNIPVESLVGAIVTPDGELYESPDRSHLFDDYLEEWELQEMQQWQNTLRQFRGQYANYIAVIVDGHG